MYHQLKYWSFPKILFMIFFGMNIFSMCYFGNLTFRSKKIDKIVTVVHKNTGMTNSGEPTFFVEFKDSSNVWSENVKYGFVYDTLKIGQKAIVKDFELKTYIFGLLCVLCLMIFGFTLSTFLDIIFKLDV